MGERDDIRRRVEGALTRLRDRSSHEEIQRLLAEMDASMAETEALIAERHRRLGEPLAGALRRKMPDRGHGRQLTARLEQVATYARRQAAHHEAEGRAGLARPWWHVVALATDDEEE